jgi:hypothetical protein
MHFLGAQVNVSSVFQKCKDLTSILSQDIASSSVDSAKRPDYNIQMQRRLILLE